MIDIPLCSPRVIPFQYSLAQRVLAHSPVIAIPSPALLFVTPTAVCGVAGRILQTQVAPPILPVRLRAVGSVPIEMPAPRWRLEVLPLER